MRYSFQLLKQFILFPDDSSSSQQTVSKFDKLIFSDEELHRLFRMIETKLLERKIWAFLTLRYYRYVKAVKKMENPIENIKQKMEVEMKFVGFDMIKKESIYQEQQEIIRI